MMETARWRSQSNNESCKNFSQDFGSFKINATFDQHKLGINVHDLRQGTKYFRQYTQDQKYQQFHPKATIQDIFISICSTNPQQLKQFYNTRHQQSLNSNRSISLQQKMQNWMDCFFMYEGSGKLIVQIKLLDLRTKKFHNYESQLSLKKQPGIQSMKTSEKQEEVKQQNLKSQSQSLKKQGSIKDQSDFSIKFPSKQAEDVSKGQINKNEENNKYEDPKGIFNEQHQKQIQQESSNSKMLDTKLLQQVNEDSDIILGSDHSQVSEKQKQQQRNKGEENIMRQDDLISEIDKNWTDISFASYLPFQNLDNMTVEQKLQKIKQIHGNEVYQELKQKARQEIEEEKKRKKMTLQQKRNTVQQLFNKYYLKVRTPEQQGNAEQQQLGEKQIEEYQQKFKSEYDKIDEKFLASLKQMLVKRKEDVQKYYKDDYYNQLDEGFYQQNQNGKKVNEIRSMLLKAKILKNMKSQIVLNSMIQL